jgi:hypothetical protein
MQLSFLLLNNTAAEHYLTVELAAIRSVIHCPVIADDARSSCNAGHFWPDATPLSDPAACQAMHPP